MSKFTGCGKNQNRNGEMVVCGDPTVFLCRGCKTKYMKELVKTLSECREFLAGDANIGPCGLGVICKIDELLGDSDEA